MDIKPLTIENILQTKTSTPQLNTLEANPLIEQMSPFGIKYFLSKVKRGFAKPSRYRMEFRLPIGVQSGLTLGGINLNSVAGVIQNNNHILNGNKTIDVMCHTAQLPSKRLLTTGYNNLLLPKQLPYFVEYDEITFTFYCDTEYSVRDYFDIWFDTVFNTHSKTVNYYNEYVSNINIYTLDTEGNINYGVVLEEAYPIAINEVELSYASQNEIQEISVTFAYKKWYSMNNSQVSKRMQNQQIEAKPLEPIQ